MKHLTTVLRIGLTLALFAVVGTACTAPTPAPTPAPTTAPAAPTTAPAAPTAAPAPTTAPTAAPPAKQVTLRWFMRWDQARLDGVAKPVIAAFEKENPNIKIEIENIGSGTEYWIKLQTMIAGGTAPDVIYPATHNAYALAANGALLFVEDFAKRDKIDLAKYEPGVLDLYKYGGKVHCLPLDTAAVAVFVNKNMFDAAGIAMPKAGWTWEDFLAAAKKLTKDTNNDGKTDQFGVDVWTSYWPVIVWSMSGHNIFDDPRKPTKHLLDDAAIDAIQWLGDLTNKHHVMPTTAERANISDMFLAGKAGMQIIGHWRVPQYMTIKDFKWDIAPLPKGKVQVNRADGSCFAVTAQSKNPEEALKFIKFLSGPDSMGVGLLLDLQQMTPALVDYQKSDRFLKPANLPGVDKSGLLLGKENLFTMYDPIHPIYDEIATAENAELGEVWNGKATAKDAVNRLIPKLNEILKKVK